MTSGTQTRGQALQRSRMSSRSASATVRLERTRLAVRITGDDISTWPSPSLSRRQSATCAVFPAATAKIPRMVAASVSAFSTV